VDEGNTSFWTVPPFAPGRLVDLFVWQQLLFSVYLFRLALTWGYTMQITGSLLGSTLFHAGGDLLIINGFIVAIHGKNSQPLNNTI